jgi:hypothetical protein
MKNESYIRITLSNLVALLARANLLVQITQIYALNFCLAGSSYFFLLYMTAFIADKVLVVNT